MGSTGGLADAARSAGKQTNTKLTSEQPSQSQKILQRQVFTSFHHNLCLIPNVCSVSCAPKTNTTIISQQYQDIAELKDQVQTSSKEKKHWHRESRKEHWHRVYCSNVLETRLFLVEETWFGALYFTPLVLAGDQQYRAGRGRLRRRGTSASVHPRPNMDPEHKYRQKRALVHRACEQERRIRIRR